ncbi:Signal peptide peptidase-like 2A [Linnemannia hyalina]|uniref:Signal peptide peptidase-like 2A n=1 Tax=Linnemannia hyalina TaxID=64524 RepID=A0A9P7Y477_9FUNG|nr:Signal peptide peptidase-like 2A [Linnemannia hyalina]
MQRQKEESGESVALTKVHAIGFGFMARSFVSIQQSMPDMMKSLGLGRGNSWHHNGVASLLVLSWFWNRNSSHAWIFQDILGGFTISLMLKVLKAPSMSSPTLLLLTAFIYDVFFVFVTPYLTSTGESIMEAAATGAALTVKETIPMLFRVPSFRPNGGEAMLGFGDVVLPGILVTFLRECDARLEEDLSLSSAMLIGMDSAAARRTRHELSLLWNGWGGLDGEESEDGDDDEERAKDESEKGKVLVI